MIASGRVRECLGNCISWPHKIPIRVRFVLRNAMTGQGYLNSSSETKHYPFGDMERSSSIEQGSALRAQQDLSGSIIREIPTRHCTSWYLRSRDARWTDLSLLTWTQEDCGHWFGVNYDYIHFLNFHEYVYMNVFGTHILAYCSVFLEYIYIYM